MAQALTARRAGRPELAGNPVAGPFLATYGREVNIEIHQIDPQDHVELRAWWEVGRAASAERAIDTWPAWEVSRVALPRLSHEVDKVLVGAWENGRFVAAGMMVLFLLDNTHLAEVNVYVSPPERRRGIGTAVLADLEARARADGRRSLLCSVMAPVGEESPGSLFAAARGYPIGSDEEIKAVDLVTAPATWPALDREVAAARGEYRVEVFENRTPAAYVDDFCALLSVLIAEIPTGDLDLEDTPWTPERLRNGEQRGIDIGRTQVVGIAIAPDGQLCGFTDLKVDRDARHGSVGATLVLPAHRGHRLGLAMKLATHRRVLELFPDLAFVETGNAGVNVWMNDVNERMGYRVVERCLDVQKRL